MFQISLFGMSNLAIICLTLIILVSSQEDYGSTTNTSQGRKIDESRKIGEHYINNVFSAIDKGVGTFISALRDIVEENRKIVDAILDNGIFGWFKSNKTRT